jgi:hypothetical protein
MTWIDEKFFTVQQLSSFIDDERYLFIEKKNIFCITNRAREWKGMNYYYYSFILNISLCLHISKGVEKCLYREREVKKQYSRIKHAPLTLWISTFFHSQDSFDVRWFFFIDSILIFISILFNFNFFIFSRAWLIDTHPSLLIYYFTRQEASRPLVETSKSRYDEKSLIYAVKINCNRCVNCQLKQDFSSFELRQIFLILTWFVSED